MRISTLLTLVLAQCGGLHASEPEHVYVDVRDQHAWFRTVVIPDREFTLPHVERRARQWLGASLPRRHLSVLSVVTNLDEAGLISTRRTESYRAWKADYEASAFAKLRVAQLVAIGENAVLRLRDADGSLLRRTVEGEDPLHVDVGGFEFEILDVNARTATALDSCEADGPSVSPVVSARTTARLTPLLSREAALRIAAVLKTSKLIMTVRNDCWFIGHHSLVYPFGGANSIPPSEGAYYDAPEFTCVVSCGGIPSCSQTNGPPLLRPAPIR